VELKWFIDSWSPTEGIAFVSQREPCEDPWALERTQTFVLRAPDFVITPVDRSIAFGATRRNFQERFGLVESRQEYGFASLQYLTAFVRRIYLGGGPGSGGEGGGSPFNGNPDAGGDNGNEAPRESYGALLDLPESERLNGVRAQLDKSVFEGAAKILEQIQWSSRPGRRHLFSDRAPHGMGWLSHQYVRPNGVPKKVGSLNDAMFFFAADRTLVSRAPLTDVMPLLLATAVYFSNPPDYYFNGWRYHDNFEWWEWKASTTYAPYIVDWLPFDQLPPELEVILETWNAFDYDEQRTSSN